ncbi:hypothetical protein F8S13_22560 [Chloroflexia bacterium SDU3-3]|nr:hypothetical protein F8S13_22560 [Chloroflexia bacterium SDU3-3]
MAQAIMTKTTETMGMETAAQAQAHLWRGTVLRFALMTGLALAWAVVFAPAAHAAPLHDGFDFAGWMTLGIDGLKKLWGLVILAELLAVVYYAVAFYTQSLFPSLYQGLQGPWVKTAVMIGLGAHVVFGLLLKYAQDSVNGYTGG